MLSIGTLQLDVPFIQAALSGYSDLPMRRIARRHGAPYALNEVVLDKLVTQKGKTRRRVLHVEPDDHPVGGQLMGANPDEFAPAAADMVEAGYDVIDINFGCPVKKVLGRCRGGFLLSQPKTALRIVRSVVDATAGRCPVTVKMRRGMDDEPESEHHFFTILDGALDAGISGVTVHGRTVRQRYVGPSDWRFLGRVVEHVRGRRGGAGPADGGPCVLGSGDLFSAERCMQMIRETGVDGVTIARGCIGNPWIFAECRAVYAGRALPDPPSVAEQGRVIADHFNEIVLVYGERHGCRLMRKFGIKYSAHHPHARDVRDAFVGVKSAEQFRAAVDRWYDPAREWPPVRRREAHGLSVPAGVAEECS
jgi:nifR3 family TIM-barrel protein